MGLIGKGFPFDTDLGEAEEKAAFGAVDKHVVARTYPVHLRTDMRYSGSIGILVFYGDMIPDIRVD